MMIINIIIPGITEEWDFVLWGFVSVGFVLWGLVLCGFVLWVFVSVGFVLWGFVSVGFVLWGFVLDSINHGDKCEDNFQG